MTGASNIFFWVKNLHPQYFFVVVVFFGLRDLSLIFFRFVLVRLNKSVLTEVYKSCIFCVGNLMTGIFWV